MLFDDPEDELFEDLDDVSDEEASSIKGEELPPPRAQGELIGHKDVEKHLLELFSGKRHPHALIFSGPKGVGKATMAFRLARYLLKSSEDEYNNALLGPSMFGDEPAKANDLRVDPKDHVFGKVAAGGHPDLLTIERLYDEKKDRRKQEVSVDEIRKIAPFMHKTAAVDGGWRIVIVDDADTMNRSSQNSILKILEEPPEKALLILVTHRIGALLPTILSRASVQSFYQLPDVMVENFITRINPKLTQDDKGLAVSMAQGSLGKAIEYADDKHIPVMAEAFDLLAAFPRPDWTRIQTFSENLGRGGTQEAINIFSESLMWLSASMLKAKAAGGSIPSGLDRFSWLFHEVSLAGWLQICESLAEHFTRSTVGNLDKKFLVMGAYMVFENNV